MGPKKDCVKTFSCCEEFSQWFAEQVVELDCTASELIRAALYLAVPIIKEYPFLLRIIDQDLKKGH